MNGTELIQDVWNKGGEPAFATNLPCDVFVGTERSEDSGVMVLGQSIDQWTVFGGRDLRSWMF